MEAAKRGIIERSHAENVLELSKVLDLVAELCATDPARIRARAITLLGSRSEVEFELERLEKVKKNLEPVTFYVPFEPGYISATAKVHAYLSIANLCGLKDFISHITSLRKKFTNSPMRDFFNKLGDYNGIKELITAKIDDEQQLRDNASPELFRIRSRKRHLKDEIQHTLKSIIAARDYLFSDLTIVERNGRQVLPVKSGYKKEMPGIVHAYSNSGETIFIEPMEITEFTAEMSDLDNREHDEIEVILASITEQIRPRVDELEDDINRIVDLDILFAKARYADECQGVRPCFQDHIELRQGYHPLLKRMRANAVPLDLVMDPVRRVLLISGPNAGGKTVVLKTVGLLALMARCGLFIPANDGSGFPYFGSVFADIGDEQSLESDLSTFAAHIQQIIRALKATAETNLVLLDELMNQTSVEEGSALAAAIMEEFSRRGDTLLATTHNENLKIYVSRKPDMLNAGMEFADQPTYRLIVGIPQPSNAIHLARQMGMDPSITGRALSFLDQEKLSIDELFKDLSRELTAVREERAALARERSDYETKLADLKLRKKKELEEVKNRYQKEIVTSKRMVERLVKTINKGKPEPATVKAAKAFYDQETKKIAAEKAAAQPYHPSVGEIVRIRDLKRAGQVVAVKNGRYKISLDNIFYWVDPVEIEPVKAAASL